MYNLQFAKKKEKDELRRSKELEQDTKWLKRYHTEIKPQLLHHYDVRINAFIRQIQETPLDTKAVIKHKESDKYPAFRFKLSENSKNVNNSQQSLVTKLKEEATSITRSSVYIPISQYQYRIREKDKEIKVKPKLKTVLYKKWQRERHLLIQSNMKEKEEMRTNRFSFKDTPRKMPEDNRSQMPSLYDDNQSLRLSVAQQNIERQAREWEKKQEHVQKKSHFKRLANLEQVVEDQKAKKSLHELLVKVGLTRPKLRQQSEEVEVDLFKKELESHLKF